MKKSLEGKVCLVTGASRGIGASIAGHLAAEGATIAVHYGNNEHAAARVCEGLPGKGGTLTARRCRDGTCEAPVTGEDAVTALCTGP